MPAPVFVQAGAGAVSTGASSPVTVTGATAGNMVILQVLIDALSNVTGATAVNVETLSGTDNSWTSAGVVWDVGSPAAARHQLFFGRVLANGTVTSNVTAADAWYARLYEFSGVHTGTTLAAVLENGTAGTFGSGQGTSASVLDTGVTTLGPDRLALNFIAVNDDNQLELTAMVGMTGGTWAYPVAAYGSATGTDGAIALVTADMPSAGTIDGGSDAITSDGWGVIGFALIPAVAAAPSGPPFVITARQRT